MNIAILDDHNDVVRTLDCFRKISGHNVTVWNDHVEDLDILTDRLRDIEVLVPIRERTPLHAPLLDRLNNLRIISQCGAANQVDVDACTRRHVILSWTRRPNQPSYATAELTVGLMIATMRQIPQQMASLKTGRWQTGIGYGLRGKTLGIFGYGQIGALVAGYGKALGMNVLIWGREGSLARARAAGYDVAPSKTAFFEQSDVVTLHVRLAGKSACIVEAADLARMKPTAAIINTSRAALIETGALEAALRAGRPAMAGVDVYENEPVSRDRHPLFAFSNVVCTPHIGYAERDAFEVRFSSIFDQILAYSSGQPVNVVNPEVLCADRPPRE